MKQNYYKVETLEWITYFKAKDMTIALQKAIKWYTKKIKDLHPEQLLGAKFFVDDLKVEEIKDNPEG